MIRSTFRPAMVPASFVEAISNGSSGWFIDDTQHVQTCNGASIFCRRSLRVVEVRRHSDHGMLHLLAKVILGSLLHLCQNHRGHLFRSHGLLSPAHLHCDHWLSTL